MVEVGNEVGIGVLNGGKVLEVSMSVVLMEKIKMGEIGIDEVATEVVP